MDLTFTHPAFAWFFFLIPALWFVPSRPRRTTHGVLRTGLFVLLVTALMQPVFVTSRANSHFVVVVDLSKSIAADSRAEALAVADEIVSELQQRGSLTVVQVGGVSPYPEASVHLQGDSFAQSPLGDALEIAAQSIPLGVSGSVTLISDGLGTDRHWGWAVDHIREREIPVHTYTLEPAPDSVFLTNVRSSSARAGEQVTVYADIVGDAESVDIELSSDGDELARVNAVTVAERRTVGLQFTAAEPGFLDVVVEIVQSDGDPQVRDSHRHIVVVQDALRLLYIGSRQKGAHEELSNLLGAGFEVFVASGTAEDVDFTEYDLVVIDDVPASEVGSTLLSALKVSVRDDGVGLFYSGGEAAFGDGGYIDSAVADVLPVKLLGKQDKVDPSIALAMILDTSGSMAGSRIELAKHIARIAVRRMQPHDRIGIVEFYGNKHWAVPMQPATNKIEIDRAIGRMKAIGGTVLYPAIQEAYFGLQNVNARYKHIVVITDAGVEDSNYEAMLRHIAKDRITVSTILVGQGGHNQIMSDLANWGRGRFYSVGNQFQLVEMIFKQRSTKKPPMYKQGTFEVRPYGSSGWWADFDRLAMPPLDGYVEVELRDGADLVIDERQQSHPILASWQYGMGRVTSFMSEPLGPGTEQWSNWTDYSEFLGRAFARTAAKLQSLDVDLNRRKRTVTLSVRRLDGALDIPRAYRVDSLSMEKEPNPLQLLRTAPNLFESELQMRRDEDLRVVVESGAHRVRIADSARSDIAMETRVDPAATLDLTRLSDVSGGEILVPSTMSEQAAIVGEGELSFIVVRLWPWILLLALLVYLSDLLYRRWPRRPASPLTDSR